MKKIKFYFLFSLLFSALVLSTGCSAQGQSSGLHYVVREPQNAQGSPALVVLLHGLGSNEEDLFSFSTSLPSNALVVSVRAPLTWGNGHAWYEVSLSDGKRVANTTQMQASLQKLVLLLDELQLKYHFNVNETVFMGFSQGAIMSYAMALQHPQLVKGIAAWSGRIDASCLQKLAETDKLKQVSFFIAHGTLDQMIPVEEARQAKQVLVGLGMAPDYHEYEAAHTITSSMFADTMSWLQALLH
jgi:phospholipase/carboxylesterase